MRRFHFILALLATVQFSAGGSDDSDDELGGRFTEEHELSDTESHCTDATEQGAQPETSAADQSASAPASARRRKKTGKGRAWPCSPHQKEFMLGKRREFDHDPKAVVPYPMNWVVSPPGASSSRTAMASPHWWWLRSWGAWAPEIFFPSSVSMPFCPTCRTCTHVKRGGWRQHGPRIILGDHRTTWYLDSKVCTRMSCT